MSIPENTLLPPARLRRALVAFLAVASVAAAAGPSARAAAAPGPAPLGLPGAPPPAETNLPTAPVMGTIPVAGPTGPAAAIPARVAGPGLLSGVLRAQGRQIAVQIACSGAGTASLSASAVGRGTLARARYRCLRHTAQAQLKLSVAAGRKLAGLGSTLGHLALGRQQSAVTLQARALLAPNWGDGGLVCQVLGPRTPYLAGPDFTVNPPAIIDVRPWIAFYTPAHGWRWLGTGGLNRSAWYRWTATSTGVLQWRTPFGALNPWTWAPISVTPGRDTYAVGAFEVVYWYHNARYVWRYVPSVQPGGAETAYCGYP